MSNGQEGPTDPSARALRLLTSQLETPETRVVRRRGLDVGAFPGGFKSGLLVGMTNPLTFSLAPALGMIRGIMGVLMGEETVENLVGEQLANQDQVGALNVLDPRVDTEGIELTSREKALHFLNRTGKSFGASLTGSAHGFPTHSGVERAVMEGNIAPANSFEDHLADFLGVTLAQIIPLGPLGVGGGLGAKVATKLGEGTAAKVAGTDLISTIGSRILPKTAARIAPFVDETGRGLGGLERVEEFLGRTIFDIGLGAGITGAEAAAYDALPGVDITPGQYAFALAAGGVLGGAANFLRLPTSTNLARAWRRANIHEANLPKPGDVVAGRVAFHGKNPRTGEVELKWRDAETGKFAAEPTEQDKLNWLRGEAENQINTLRQVVETNPQAQTGEMVQLMQQRARLPEDVAAEMDDVSLLMARWYESQADKFKKLSPRGQARRMQAYGDIIQRQDIPLNERKYAAGALMGMERAAGQSEGLLPGMTPLETEIAALKWYEAATNKYGFGADDILKQMDKLEEQGTSSVFAQRVRELVKRGGTPESAKLQESIRKVTQGWGRGMRGGSEVLVEGQRYKLVSNPSYGLAKGIRLTKPDMPPIEIDIATATPVPKVGTYALLDDGMVVEVVREAGKTKFMGRQPGTQVPAEIPYARVVSVGDDIPAQRMQEAKVATMLGWLDAGDVEAVAPRRAVTKQGEEVLVMAEGSQAVQVETPQGPRIIPKEDVVPSNAAKPAMGSGEVVDFAPGTVPDKGNKQLFFMVDKDNTAAFEQSLKDGTVGQFVANRAGGISVHVLPPTQRAEGVQLYALEVPARSVPNKAYGPDAQKARQAIAGKAQIQDYLSGISVDPAVIAEGRVSRVADELWSAAVLPEEVLQQMTQKEQSEYLRRVLNFHQHVDSRLGKAATKKQESLRIAQEAQAAGDGPLAAQARESALQSEIDAVDAVSDMVSQATEPLEFNLESIMAEMDPNYGTWSRLMTEGLNEETALVFETSLEALPSGRTWLAQPRETVPDEAWLIGHSETPGLRLQVHKEQRMRLVDNEPQFEEVYRVVPYDAEGRLIEEGAETFLTPAGVTQYAQSEGFTRPPTIASRTGWINTKRPNLGADIYAEGGRVKVSQTEQIEIGGSGRRYVRNTENVSSEDAARIKQLYRGRPVEVQYNEGTGTLRLLSKELAQVDNASLDTGLKFEEAVTEVRAPATKEGIAQAQRARENEKLNQIMVFLGEDQIDTPTGTHVHVRRGSVAFDTVEEAETWLQEQGFSNLKPLEAAAGYEGTVAERFGRLPALDEIEGGIGAVEEAVIGTQLQDTAAAVELMIQEALAENRLIPEALHNYARRLAKLHYQVLEQPAFTRSIRDKLGVYDINDLLPTMRQQHVFDDPYDASLELDTSGSRPDRGQTRSVAQRTREKMEWTLRQIEKGELNVPEAEVAQLRLAHERLMQHVQRESQVSMTGAPHTVPDDVVALPADVTFTHDPAPTDFARGVMKLVTREREFSELSPIHRKTLLSGASDVDSPLFGTDNVQLARTRDTEQLVQVVHSDPANTKSVTVRYPDGTEMEEAVSNLNMVRSTDHQIRSWHTMKAVADGDYESLFRREPGLGQHPIDQRLGILGTQSLGVTREAYAGRVDQLMKTLYKAKGGVLTGPQESMNELLEILGHSQWLGASKLVGKTRQWRPLFDDLLQKIPREMHAPIRRAIYENARLAGGDTPMSDLIARAAAGIKTKQSDTWMLSQKHADVINDWAQRAGLVRNLPLARKALEMVSRMMSDPAAFNAANELVSIKRNAGFLNIGLSLADIPSAEINVVTTGLDDLTGPAGSFAYWFGIPWKTSRKHPMPRMMMDMTYEAQELQNKAGKAKQYFFQQMREMGVAKKQDRRDLMNYVLAHGRDWDAAQKAGARPELQQAFHRLGQEIDDGLERVIRMQIKTGVRPVRWEDPNLSEAARRQLRTYAQTQLQLDPKTIAEGAQIRVASVRLRGEGHLDLFGQVGREIPEDEIQALLTARRMYKDASELPSGYPDWIYEQFDHWKSYGINNYWPNVWEGGMAIEVEREGTKQLIGWAHNRIEGLRIVSGLMDEGRLATTADGRLAESVTFQNKRPTVDDITVQHFAESGGKDIRALNIALAEHMRADPDEVTALVLKYKRPRAMRKPDPKLAHALERTANLKPPVDDPWKGLSLYFDRIARSEYRMRVAEAWNMMNDENLDRVVSAAWHQEPLTNHSKLHRFMTQWTNRALGEPGEMETFWNGMIASYNMARYTPDRILNKLKGKASESWGSTLFPGSDAYYRHGASRMTAGQIISFQSKWRLAGNLASGVANASQFFVNTVPMLIDDVTNEAAAMALASVGYKDAISLWARETAIQTKDLPSFLVGGALKRSAKGLQNLKYQQLQELAAEAGIDLMPAKYTAGMDQSSWATAMGQFRVGGGAGSRALDAFNWTGMIAFNGAERVNRLATLFAVYRREMGKMGVVPMTKGPAHTLALARAKYVIRNTQFLYDELSMPLAFTEGLFGGPMGRVLFQFKSFMVNQLSFQKDLAKKAFVDGDNVARRQLLLHLAAYGTLGGVRGVMSHPLITAGLFVGAAAYSGKLDSSYLTNLIVGGPLGWRERRYANMSPEDRLMDNYKPNARDALYYGLPGLLGYNLGQRIGISGQELGMTFQFPGTLGPHASIYPEAWMMYSRHKKQPHDWSREALGGLTGFALAQLLPVPGAGKKIGQYPLASLASAITGMALASRGADNSFAEYLSENSAARRFKRRALPSAIRDISDFLELQADSAIIDTRGKPTYIPTDNLWQEKAAALFGLPTVREEEYSSWVGFHLAEAEGHQLAEVDMAERIAQARIKAPNPIAGREAEMRLLDQATRLGLTITPEQIDRQVQNLLMEAKLQVERQIPPDQR